MSLWLVMQTNDGNERPFAVQKPAITIGRENNCDVRVPIPSVDQKHCQILIEGDQAKLVDLRSQSGTFHNGQRVEHAILTHEDKLTIGPVTFIVRVKKDAVQANGVKASMPDIVIERQMPTNSEPA